MQTERVTFLTTPDHKAALDAFAASNGMSVGHVVREASAIYIAQTAAEEDEEQLAALVREVNEAVPRMREDIKSAIASINRANAAVDAVLAGEGPRR
jgi:KaiC/GvpD/RAD55 family RecA-like ATPase